MRWRGAVFVLALCTLEASGAQQATIEYALSPIDTSPTKQDILNVTDPGNSIDQLHSLAITMSVDFGVQIRAIRALPLFCQPSCKNDPGVAPARAALLDIFSLPPLGPNGLADRSGRTLLRLRAAIEALGEERSGEDADVDLIAPFLNDASRDLRATTARAMRTMCNQKAAPLLHERYQAEMIEQVKLAISDALRELTQCQPP
jgi:hypothetical protein